MSIAEYGAVTDEEMKALMTLRGQRFSWAPYSFAAYPNEFRALCRRLAERGFATIQDFGHASEAAKITDAGMEASFTQRVAA